MLIESKSEPTLAADPWTLYLYAMGSPATKEKWESLANLFLANHRYTRDEATLQ
jgi:hypothetical protein